MERIELTAHKREIIGKQARRLRREGWVPAVVYGPDVGSLPIQVERHEMLRALAGAGLSHLIMLRIDDGKTPYATLVREVQRDVLTDDILHVDFLQVQMAQRISTTVSLHLVGESPAVETLGGVLIQGITEVEIECLPDHLVDAIEVDIGALTELDQEITVADLPTPPGVEVLTEPEEMVARVIPTYEEVEEEEEVPISPAEVEVIRRPRREEEEEDLSEESD